jgi:hypothetical protein
MSKSRPDGVCAFAAFGFAVKVGIGPWQGVSRRRFKSGSLEDAPPLRRSRKHACIESKARDRAGVKKILWIVSKPIVYPRNSLKSRESVIQVVPHWNQLILGENDGRSP